VRRLLPVALVFAALGAAIVVTMPSTQPQPVEPAPRASDRPTPTPPAVASNAKSSPVETPAPTYAAQVAQLYVDCVADTQTPAGQIATGGQGRSVAVIGDSITTQIRERLIDDPARRWVVWSRCGATVQTALDADVPARIRAEHPDVVIVALGTNDAGFPTPTPGSSVAFEGRAQRLLEQLAGVPCVVWVNVAEQGDPVLQAEMDRVNVTVQASGVPVVDWDREVQSETGLLLDRVHLSRQGQELRRQLIADAARC